MSTALRRTLAYAAWPAARVVNALAPGVRILMYHRVTDEARGDQLAVPPQLFEEQIASLAARHRLVSMSQALEELKRGTSAGGAVAVTFDDGYLDNLTHALPILERYRVPATIFVTTSFCDQRAMHPRYPHARGRLHLDWEEVGALARHPLITIGSHTVTHPHLQRIDDAAAWHEISDSRATIEARIACAVEYFCYPSGDMGTRERELVRQAGYCAAVTVAPGTNRRTTPRFELKRTEISFRDAPEDLALKLTGAFDPMHAVLHARRRARFARAAHATR